MRVLLVSHTCQSRLEGQPKAWELARRGIELCVLVPERWRAYGKWTVAQPPAGDAPFRFEVQRTRLPWAGPAQTFLHTYPGLGRLVREFGPDVIDVWEEPWSRVSVQALNCRERDAPSAKVVSETEQNINKRLPWPFEAYRRRVLAGCDAAVGRSREAVEVLREKGYHGLAKVVPNAVDADLFRPLDEDARREARRRLELTGFVAGYVGRLTEEKGLYDLIDALPAARPDVRVLLVGDGPHREILQARAGRLGVADRVRFAGKLPLDALPQVMNAIDVLVLPSRTTGSWKEQFGRVLIEAQACATPVVGSSSGAIPDVVGTAGRVFREGDAAELAGVLDDLSSDPTRLRDLGLNGRRRVEAEFTWGRVAESMIALYKQVTAGG